MRNNLDGSKQDLPEENSGRKLPHREAKEGNRLPGK